ncbi:hypothetical protein GCM10022419_046750 [Nonomuraea rosea]|uniref:DUF397 domain-containing protein n=1 Tax=Nonomuraea rosea TaxID=638574 RepID=A0ABP6X5P4_9ACTN
MDIACETRSGFQSDTGPCGLRLRLLEVADRDDVFMTPSEAVQMTCDRTEAS